METLSANEIYTFHFTDHQAENIQAAGRLNEEKWIKPKQEFPSCRILTREILIDNKIMIEKSDAKPLINAPIWGDKKGDSHQKIRKKADRTEKNDVESEFFWKKGLTNAAHCDKM